MSSTAIDAEIYSGDDALIASADLLYRNMSCDARLQPYFENLSLADFATKLRIFLEGTFEGEWPEMVVNQELIDEAFDDLVHVLTDVLQSQLPPDEDPLLASMDVLCGDMKGDARVQKFYEQIRSMASSEDYVDDEEALGDEENQDNEDAKNASAKDAGNEVNTKSFEDLVLDPAIVQAANDAWRLFISTAESREAAGEAIYAALFEGAPSLQSLFTTPRAVQAMRFMNGLASFVMALDDPPKLKILVETLGFGHLHLDVTVPRAVIFRDAILDLFMMELAEKFTKEAREGWKRLLNYVAGALIFIKQNYAERITVLLKSWKLCNIDKDKENIDEEGASDNHKAAKKAKKAEAKKGWFGKKADASQAAQGAHASGTEGTAKETAKDSAMIGSQGVPTTYPEMFMFNAAVMGFGNSAWMSEVLACFHNIVTNVANSARLAEECDVLALRVARVVKGDVKFAEYKSCMLASLRSLLPKDWDGKHEIAWNWLWENVERLILRVHGQPPIWEKALAKIVSLLDADEAMKYEFRKDIYARVFTVAPASQDYFKQSNTYLHVIADKIIQMTLDMFQFPVKMVDDISALGLRHVGYGIPTELFGPFVTACCEVLMSRNSDETTVESFRWSLGLVSKMLVRTITEGSTIVMKAINQNSQRLLKKAISCAPRGERAQWMLLIQVGTQRISPLGWSIESGNLEGAIAILKDLLTFRADRDRYYYGVDELFNRHPDIIKMLCDMAPDLLPNLFGGLIWRSRNTDAGLRRVNYYVKHLLVNEEGSFAPALKWITATRDPKIVCHPVIVLVSDIVWTRVAYRSFLSGKSFLFFTLLIFIIQSVLKHAESDKDKGDASRICIFACRMFIYLFSMTQFMYRHLRDCIRAYKTKDTIKLGCIPIPKYLKVWQDAASFILTISLVFMLVLEPIFWCFQHQDGKIFLDTCSEREGLLFPYSLFSMTSMFLYYALLLDLTVLSTAISAFVLVCVRAVSEVGLFLGALTVSILTFSSAISVLKQDSNEFAGIHKGALHLLQMTLQMYDANTYKTFRDEPTMLAVVFAFLIATVVFLLSLLVAQLSCAYSAVYADMVGYARLERGQIIVEIMPSVSRSRWERFTHSLKLRKRLEFNEGDIGVAGGIQVKEPAAANPTTIDMIRRFGGSTSVEIQWPEEENGDGDGDDRFERIEKLIQRTLQTVSNRGGGSKGGGESSEQSGTKLSGSNSGGSEAEE